MHAYVEAIAARVSSSASALLDDACERQNNLSELAGTVYSSIGKPESGGIGGGLQWERKVLDKLVEFEIKKNSKNFVWSLSRGGLDQVMLDFRMLLQAGDHVRTMQNLVTDSRRYFVTEEEEIAIRKRTDIPPTEIENKIDSLVAVRMEPFWGFSFFLCRVLMEKDNPLSPEDAFWLGLIDEVAGNDDLPTLRKAFETPPSDPGANQLELPEA